jgi:hypothetical protein
MSEAAKFDPHRGLCPDGACIGVIGSDGRCRVCGRPAGGSPGDAPPAGFVPPAFADDDDAVDEAGDDERVSAEGSAGGTSTGAGKAAAFDPNRRLCPDGECLGVIGVDGVCNVCGKKPE